MMLNIANSKICIVSYIHESGLYYLAKYFFDDLINKGNEIVWIPKIRYKLKNGTYNREVEMPIGSKVPNAVSILSLDDYCDFFKKNTFDHILSFETNMREEWVKKNIDKITDIPMIEWVDVRFLSYYKFLKKIICLNQFTFNKLRENNNCEVIKFALPHIGVKKQGFCYHQASLNSDYSSKNTDSVIRAFKNIDENLVITGILSESQQKCLSGNIKYLGVVSRFEVLNLYAKANALVAPSSIEGFGLQIYEAKSYGCKIICSDFPTIKCLADYTINLNSNVKIYKQIINLIKGNNIFTGSKHGRKD